MSVSWTVRFPDAFKMKSVLILAVFVVSCFANEANPGNPTPSTFEPTKHVGTGTPTLEPIEHVTGIPTPVTTVGTGISTRIPTKIIGTGVPTLEPTKIIGKGIPTLEPTKIIGTEIPTRVPIETPTLVPSKGFTPEPTFGASTHVVTSADVTVHNPIPTTGSSQADRPVPTPSPNGTTQPTTHESHTHSHGHNSVPVRPTVTPTAAPTWHHTITSSGYHPFINGTGMPTARPTEASKHHNGTSVVVYFNVKNVTDAYDLVLNQGSYALIKVRILHLR
jgi:hypothetical protein